VANCPPDEEILFVVSVWCKTLFLPSKKNNPSSMVSLILWLVYKTFVAPVYIARCQTGLTLLFWCRKAWYSERLCRVLYYCIRRLYWVAHPLHPGFSFRATAYKNMIFYFMGMTLLPTCVTLHLVMITFMLFNMSLLRHFGLICVHMQGCKQLTYSFHVP